MSKKKNAEIFKPDPFNEVHVTIEESDFIPLVDNRALGEIAEAIRALTAVLKRNHETNAKQINDCLGELDGIETNMRHFMDERWPDLIAALKRLEQY